MKAIRVSQLALAGIAVVALAFIAAGIANELKLRKLRRGITVAGHVLDGGQLPRAQGAKTHYLRVEFQTDGGRSEAKYFPVDQDDFVRATRSGMIPVTYAAADPELSRVGTHFGYDRTPLYAAIMALLLVACMVGVIRFSPRPKMTTAALQQTREWETHDGQ